MVHCHPSYSSTSRSPQSFLSSDREISPPLCQIQRFFNLLCPFVSKYHNTSPLSPPASFLNKPLRWSEQQLAPGCRGTIFILSLRGGIWMATGEGVLGNSHTAFLLASSFLSGPPPFVLSCSLLSVHFVCLFLSNSIKMKKSSFLGESSLAWKMAKILF